MHYNLIIIISYSKLKILITIIITFDEQVVQVSFGTNELSELVNLSETPLTNSRFYDLTLAEKSQSALYIENMEFPGTNWYRSFSGPL